MDTVRILSRKGDKEAQGVPGLGGSWAGGSQLWLFVQLEHSGAEKGLSRRSFQLISLNIY